MNDFVVLAELYEESTGVVYTELDSSYNTKTSIGDNRFSLRKIIINKKHIVLLKEDTIMKHRHDTDKLSLGLDKKQEFTRIYFSCSGFIGPTVTVVGALSLIAEKIFDSAGG